jgi:hypothetical protein
MPTNNPKSWQSTKRSVFLPRGTEPEIDEVESAHYSDMFREDVSMLLPSYDNARSVIRLQPEDRAVERLIEEAIRWHHDGIGLAAEVSEFVRLAARTVARYGIVYYEISFETRETESKPSQFHLHPLEPESVFVRRGELYQRVAPHVARQHAVPEIIHIPREMLCVMTPGRKWSLEFKRITAALTTLSHVILPKFAHSEKKADKAVPFDGIEFLRTQTLAVLSVTKRTGWNARRTSSGIITGYYWFRRWLRFERLKIELRNALIECLNDALGRVGKQLGFSAKITVSALPELSDVTTAEKQLQDGAMLLSQIIKPFLRT